MRIYRENALFTLILIIGIFLTIQAGKVSLASLHYYAAKSHLDRWKTDLDNISNNDYLKALSSAKTALRLQPSLALYSDTVSEILQWGAYSGVVSRPDKNYRDALKYNLYSLKLRPGWAITWLNIAYIKWQLGELDSDFYHFLEMANKLGRNMPEVNLFYIEVGFYLIDYDLNIFFNHNIEVQRRVRLALSNVNTAKSVIVLAKKYDKENLVCEWSKDTPFIGYDDFCD